MQDLSKESLDKIHQIILQLIEASPVAYDTLLNEYIARAQTELSIVLSLLLLSVIGLAFSFFVWMPKHKNRENPKYDDVPVGAISAVFCGIFTFGLTCGAIAAALQLASPHTSFIKSFIQ